MSKKQKEEKRGKVEGEKEERRGEKRLGVKLRNKGGKGRKEPQWRQLARKDSSTSSKGSNRKKPMGKAIAMLKQEDSQGCHVLEIERGVLHGIREVE